MSSDAAMAAATGTDWRVVADDLADALQQAMLRNPNLNAQAYGRAQAALGRYEGAKGNVLLSVLASDETL
jgi:hypothetical protein